MDQSGFVRVVCLGWGTLVKVADGDGIWARNELVQGLGVPYLKLSVDSWCSWGDRVCGNLGMVHVFGCVMVSRGGSGGGRVVYFDPCEELCCVVVAVCVVV